MFLTMLVASDHVRSISSGLKEPLILLHPMVWPEVQ